MEANKVQFGLSNVRYGKVTFDDNDIPTFYPPKRWRGAVKLSMTPEGEISTFWADDIEYYVATSNNGYTCDFESALTPEEFDVEIMKIIKDTKGVLLETSNTKTEHFYWIFEVDGDQHKKRFLFYNCIMERAESEFGTKQESVEVNAGTRTLKVMPLPNGLTGLEPEEEKNLIKSSTSATTDPAAYADWFKAPYNCPMAPTTPAKASTGGDK